MGRCFIGPIQFRWGREQVHIESHSARRKSGPGAGLGLAIAEEIVERHGGKLTPQNRSPKELRQKIVLPACFAQ